MGGSAPGLLIRTKCHALSSDWNEGSVDKDSEFHERCVRLRSVSLSFPASPEKSLVE